MIAKQIRAERKTIMFYIRKEKIRKIKFSEFYDAIKDNPKAVEELNTVFPNAKLPYNDNIKDLRKLASVVDVYNS